MLTPESLTEIIAPVIGDTEFELVELKIQPVKGRVKYVVVMDHRERGVTLDELERWSRRFEEELDMRPEVPRTYALDVTSPGADRPLHKEWEFRKNVGRELEVELQPAEGEKQGPRFKAKLDAVRDGELHFEDGRQVAMDIIKRANVALPW